MTVLHSGQRAATLPSPPASQPHVRAASLNEEARSFVAVASSEQPVQVFDFRTGDIVDEVLLADGGEFPESVPLLDSHQRSSTTDVVGSMGEFKQAGTLWEGRGTIAFNDERADSIWSKIRDGHLDSVSIGYTVSDYSLIRAGQTRVVNGRSFTANDDYSLRIVTKWAVHEVSIVAVPADSNAKIRSSTQTTDRSKDTMSTKAPAAHSRNSVTGRPSLGGLVSAMLIRSGVNDPSRCRAILDIDRVTKLPATPQLEREAEQGHYWSTSPMVDLLRMALELDGVRANRSGGASGIMHQASKHLSRGLTGGNAEQLFTQTSGALFLQGWQSEEDSTAGFVSESDNLTLKPTPRVRPLLGALGRRGSGETAKQVTLDVPGETTQLAEFSARFSIDEIDLINNQFGNFEQLGMRELGAAARRMRPDLVYSTLLRNANMRDGKALFHADHANLHSGSLTIDNLATARSGIAKQSESGIPLNLRGKYLIVPQSLEQKAVEAARAIELHHSDSNSGVVVRTDSRLDNGLVDPTSGEVLQGSETDWYVSASGSQHTIELQYLAGTGRQPRIRFGFQTGGEFGIWFDVQHFIGAKAIDWRGLAKAEV